MRELNRHCRDRLGPAVAPREIAVIDILPKTRSGKIMRRLMADMTAGRSGGDVTSLQDETALAGVELAWQRYVATRPRP